MLGPLVRCLYVSSLSKHLRSTNHSYDLDTNSPALKMNYRQDLNEGRQPRVDDCLSEGNEEGTYSSNGGPAYLSQLSTPPTFPRPCDKTVISKLKMWQTYCWSLKQSLVLLISVMVRSTLTCEIPVKCAGQDGGGGGEEEEVMKAHPVWRLGGDCIPLLPSTQGWSTVRSSVCAFICSVISRQYPGNLQHAPLASSLERRHPQFFLYLIWLRIWKRDAQVWTTDDLTLPWDASEEASMW